MHMIFSVGLKLVARGKIFNSNFTWPNKYVQSYLLVTNLN